jgi:exodeoxyribonuclease VII large subunit
LSEFRFPGTPKAAPPRPERAPAETSTDASASGESRATVPAPAETRANVAEFSVSEIAFAVKRTIEDAYGFVRVRGEISGYRGPHSSGHAYFSLKDDKARIEAVVWRTSFQRLRFKPEEGMEVIATGKLTTFPGGSKYQIVIEALEPAGVGALMALLEERRTKLAAEGLFDEARKRPLPFLPRVIGVVTSPTGAVIRDILHRLSDRFPVHVLVWPVRVQGDGSAAEVAAAIRGFGALGTGGALPRPDLLIVARGGGSLEDLWGFNDEAVVRAAAESPIPLISAVGHETDWTLLDHAADRRAPTPTGAAEMAVPVRLELLAAIDDYGRRIDACARRGLIDRRQALRALARALPQAGDLVATARQRLDLTGARLGHALAGASRQHRTRYERAAARLTPEALLRLLSRRRERLDAVALGLRVERLKLGEARSRLDRAGAGLTRCFTAGTERRRRDLGAMAKLLESFSYKGTLARGYALVLGPDGHLVRSVAAVPEAFTVQLSDGKLAARRADAGPPEDGGGGSIAAQDRSQDAAEPGVNATTEAKRPAQPARAAARPKRSSEDQGRLF